MLRGTINKASVQHCPSVQWKEDEAQLETLACVYMCGTVRLVIRGAQHSSAEIKFPEFNLTVSITSGNTHTITHAQKEVKMSGSTECCHHNIFIYGKR